MGVEDALNAMAREHGAGDSRERLDRGGAGRASEHRNLADAGASAKLREQNLALRPARVDADGAVHHEVHRVAEIAFAKDRLARFVLHDERVGEELVSRFVIERFEEMTPGDDLFHVALERGDLVGREQARAGRERREAGRHGFEDAKTKDGFRVSLRRDARPSTARGCRSELGRAPRTPGASVGSDDRRVAERASAAQTFRPMTDFDFDAAFRSPVVVLAPMEDVSDAVFRRICRARGAELCVTEFVNVEGLLRGCRNAAHKVDLAPDDRPTAIQIYGADAARLAEAAEVAERSEPAWIDVNCGCWVPKIARRGAGAGWLRDPDAMVAMAKMVVERVSLPVTVKTRIGWSHEGGELPIVELARRLEDVGVRALTIHCRTATMGHSGEADWSWAARVREVVSIPVIVNGDVRSADDAARAIAETGCEGVMIGRRAIEHPWVFREVRARLERDEVVPSPSAKERFELCREHLLASIEERGELRAVRAMRRYYPGYLHGLPGAGEMRRALNAMDDAARVLAAFDAWQERAMRAEELYRAA